MARDDGIRTTQLGICMMIRLVFGCIDLVAFNNLRLSTPLPPQALQLKSGIIALPQSQKQRSERTFYILHAGSRLLQDHLYVLYEYEIETQHKVLISAQVTHLSSSNVDQPRDLPHLPIHQPNTHTYLSKLRCVSKYDLTWCFFSA